MYFTIFVLFLFDILFIYYRVTDEIEALCAILLDDELRIKENDRYVY